MYVPYVQKRLSREKKKKDLELKNTIENCQA